MDQYLKEKIYMKWDHLIRLLKETKDEGIKGIKLHRKRFTNLQRRDTVELMIKLDTQSFKQIKNWVDRRM